MGTAVGDAIGLPAEGLSRRRARRLYPGRWRHRFIAGKGMVSDDTDHAFLVGQCLLAEPLSAAAFASRLGWCLRGWLLALPAGVGWATLRAIVRLWLGVRSDRSGVFSAGNGPSMRSALIGARFDTSADDLEAFVTASTRLTHTDPRALTGSMAIARLTAWITRDGLTDRPPASKLIACLRSCGEHDAEWLDTVSKIEDAATGNRSVIQFADALGLEYGVSGYVYHTVPVAVYSWYRHFGDFEKSLESVLDCGGDTDTTGAIVGALAGASVGEEGIPTDWIDGLVEWPRTTSVMRRLADELQRRSRETRGPVHYFWPGCIARNAVFLIVVLLHGFRRILPPYG